MKYGLPSMIYDTCTGIVYDGVCQQLEMITDLLRSVLISSNRKKLQGEGLESQDRCSFSLRSALWRFKCARALEPSFHMYMCVCIYIYIYIYIYPCIHIYYLHTYLLKLTVRPQQRCTCHGVRAVASLGSRNVMLIRTPWEMLNWGRKIV